MVEANNASVVSAYEDKIDKLERDKFVLQEKIDKAVPDKGRLEDCIELSLRFLASPWNIYKNGDFAMRQTVLRLAFAEPLRYAPNGMYRTPEFSFPFRYLGGFLEQKSEMVLPERFELSTSPLPRECSTPELRQRSAWRGDKATGRECKGILRPTRAPSLDAPLDDDRALAYAVGMGGDDGQSYRQDKTAGCTRPSGTRPGKGPAGGADPRPAGGAGAARAERLKAALKANMQRRKAARREAVETEAAKDKPGRAPEEGQDG